MNRRETSRTIRVLGGICATVLVLFWAQQSQAQVVQINSEVNGNFDFKVGPYFPNIEAEFAEGDRPFSGAFGTDKRLLGQVSAEYYLWQGHGKLGLGATAGYTRFTGSSEIEGDGTAEDGANDQEGSTEGNNLDLNEEARFTVFPLGVIAAYRWDFLVHQFGLPIAAKIEGGLDYYLWKISDGSGNVATIDGNRAAGGTPGAHATLRGEFLLDWVDPQSAASFDMSWGINNTYLFAEYTFSRVQDLNGQGFRLGDNFWQLGLAFEF